MQMGVARPAVVVVERGRDEPFDIGIATTSASFSGRGGPDLAVKEVFDARIVWFSTINEPVARILAHHWPDASNLGDITTIDWGTVPPVDLLCGGFPCINVKWSPPAVRGR